MKKLLKYFKEIKESDYSNNYKKRLEYEYNICKKILPDLIKFKDKNINSLTKISYNDSIRIAGEFFGSISRELESDFYNIINNEKSDITKFEQTEEERRKDWDSLFGGPKLETKYGYSVKFKSNDDKKLDTYEDYLSSLTGSSSSYGYTKVSMLGNIADINTIVHEFAHRFSLGKNTYKTFEECPSIYSELMLYDYMKKNNIVSEEEIFELQKVKFTSYLYRIVIPKIIDKNALDFISSSKSVDEVNLEEYLSSLDDKSLDKFAIKFAIKNPEVFDKANRQGFEYIEGALLASYMKNNNIGFDKLITDLAHCVDNEDIFKLYNSKYGINVVSKEGELRLDDNIVNELSDSLCCELNIAEVSKESSQKIKGLNSLVKSDEEVSFSYIKRQSNQIRTTK